MVSDVSSNSSKQEESKYTFPQNVKLLLKCFIWHIRIIPSTGEECEELKSRVVITNIVVYTVHNFGGYNSNVNKMMFHHKHHHCSTNESHISPQEWWPSCPLAAMADLTAFQTKLETLSWLTAGLEQHRVAVGVAVELLHRCFLDGRTAAGAGVAAGGAEGMKAGGAGLQQTQEQHRALAP